MSEIKKGKWTNKNLQNTTQKTKDRQHINKKQEQQKSNKNNRYRQYYINYNYPPLF